MTIVYTTRSRTDYTTPAEMTERGASGCDDGGEGGVNRKRESVCV